MGFWKALMLPGAPSAMAHHDANGRFSELEKVGDDNETDETVNRIISTLGLDEYSQEWKVVNHIIAESINNVCHHSDSFGYAAAQYYPKTDVVEISIGDYGIGLRQSLSRLYPLESDGEAILKALEPNVTSNPPHPGQKERRNRGVGLTTVYRLVQASQGKLRIWTGDALWEDTVISSQDRPWKGTILSIKVRRANLTLQFREIMRQIEKEILDRKRT